jgi:hypothetical protein
MPEPLSPVRVVAFDETVAATAPVHIKTVSAPDPLDDGVNGNEIESQSIGPSSRAGGDVVEPVPSETA